VHHPFRWKKLSIACAIGYRPGSNGTRLCFQIVADSHNDNKLIEFLRKLKRHFGGQPVVVIWDGLPSHRSRVMSDYLATQRSWLEIVRLPGYAPDLNPVEGLWGLSLGDRRAALAIPAQELREVERVHSVRQRGPHPFRVLSNTDDVVHTHARYRKGRSAVQQRRFTPDFPGGFPCPFGDVAVNLGEAKYDFR
jgi:hypothetical protein